MASNLAPFLQERVLVNARQITERRSYNFFVLTAVPSMLTSTCPPAFGLTFQVHAPS